MKRIVALIVTLALLTALAFTFTACDANMGKFYVNYDKQDGSPVTTKSQWVRLDESKLVVRPDEPTRNDHTFGGWFKEPACINEWDFDNDKLKSGDNITLYAKFTTTNLTETSPTETNLTKPIQSVSGLGCADCNDIQPYQARHGDNKDEGVFWELPYFRAGTSALPMVDINRQPINWGQYDSWSPQLFVIDSYDDLSQMRLGNTNSSRPIIHDYSEKYFENNALLFAQVTTSSMGHVTYVRFETLVTDAEALYPIFSLNLPDGNHGWDCAIGSIMFLIEVPQALLENYELGNIGWIQNSGVAVWMGGQLQEGQINRLPSVQKTDCDCLFGLNVGEDDSVWVEYNYVFQAEGENYRFIGNSGNSSHTLYIRYDDNEEFVFATWAHVFPSNSTNWDRVLMDLPLKVGDNQLMIVSGTTQFINGVDERTYGYASVFLSDEINTQSYEYNISGTTGNQSFSFNSAGLHKVYVRRAGREEYEPIFGGFPVAGSLKSNWATRSVGLETFDFQLGINTVMLVNYTYNNGVVTRNETKWEIERTADTVVDYNFRIGNVVVRGQSVLWDGNGFYYPYVKRAGENEFTGVMGWGISCDSGVALSQIYCAEGLNEIKVTQMQFAGGKVSLYVGLFSFNYKTVNVSNQVDFVVKDSRLTWDKASAWDYAHVFIKYPDKDDFEFADIARSGRNTEAYDTGFNLAWLKTGYNTLKITYDWSYSSNTITEYSAHWSTNWPK